MNNQTVIGISGKTKVGKNTLAELMAEILHDKYKITSCELAFANALKDEVAKAAGTTRLVVDMNKEIYRPLLQGWGTWRRNQYKDYWVQKVLSQLLNINDCRVVFITDVRFVNEANYLKEIGAKLIRLTRITGREDKDISETDLDSYEFPVKFHNTTLEALRNFAELTLTTIKL
jgi:phosphomevalonate kinase